MSTRREGRPRTWAERLEGQYEDLQQIVRDHPEFVDRFWAKVEKTEGCWTWKLKPAWGGYAYMQFGTGDSRFNRVAHRIAYMLLLGPIPEGLVLDHLCRVRHCVNPAHLEPVTSLENTRRGRVNERERAKTHCPSGHPYSAENTRITKEGHRECRICRRATWRRSNKRQWAKRKAAIELGKSA